MTDDTTDLIRLLRTLHDRLAALVVDLGPDQLRSQSYDTDWTVADVLSHLGSGAELSLMRLRHGGGDGPSHEQMAHVWATWDARTPEQQAVESMVADDAYVSALEQLDEAQADAMRRELAGLDLDAASLLRLRVAEHAMHGWDAVVPFDDSAVLPAMAVPVLLDVLPVTLRFAAQPHDDEFVVRVTTTEPERDLLLELAHGETRIRDVDADPPPDLDGRLDLPAEALLRLVYGRLDPQHTPPHKTDHDALLDRLRGIFRGF